MHLISFHPQSNMFSDIPLISQSHTPLSSSQAIATTMTSQNPMHDLNPTTRHTTHLPYQALTPSSPSPMPHRRTATSISSILFHRFSRCINVRTPHQYRQKTLSAPCARPCIRAIRDPVVIDAVRHERTARSAQAEVLVSSKLICRKEMHEPLRHGRQERTYMRKIENVKITQDYATCRPPPGLFLRIEKFKTR